jgi:hypothetical protein
LRELGLCRIEWGEDADLAPLCSAIAGLSELQRLELEGGASFDAVAGLALAGATGLTQLLLSCAPAVVPGNVLRAFASRLTRLQSLELTWSTVAAPADLACLSALTRLTELTVDDNGASCDEVAAVLRQCRRARRAAAR